jgi:hypothetical protein
VHLARRPHQTEKVLRPKRVRGVQLLPRTVGRPADVDGRGERSGQACS